MKKIMFNDKYGLTEAVLSGRKTQTRRVMQINEIEAYLVDFNKWVCEATEKTFIVQQTKYKVGEIVAVAQSYKNAGVAEVPSPIENIFFEAHHLKGWNNKMFVRADLMPHRIRITNVRVDLLQDISDEDCIKEGVGISATDNRIGYPFSIPFNYYVGEDKEGCRYSTPREAYAALIDRISGKGTWECNPYVFVYDFELIKS